MSGGTNDDEDERTFLQARLSSFGFFGAGLGLSFWLFRIVNLVATRDYALARTADMSFHFLGAFVFLILRVVCRMSTLSRRGLEVADSLAVFASVCCYVAMGPMYRRRRVRTRSYCSPLAWGS